MAKSHPHKQTVIIALVCAVAVGGTMAYVHWQKPSAVDTTPVRGVDIGAGPENNPIVSTSSVDWQKQFFATIGTTTTLGGASAQPVSNEPLSLTDQLSRDFFSRYVQLQQNGFIGNQQLQQDTVQQTIDATVNAAAQPTSYTAKDLVVSAQADTVALHTYGNAVASIFISSMPTSSAIDVLNNAVNSGDMSLLSGIDQTIAAYKKTVAGLRAVPVPQPMISYHLGLINSISAMLSAAEDMQNVQGDPMQTMVSLGNYSSIQDDMKAAFLNMKNYFTITNISFAPTESGAFFSTITP